MFSSFLRRRLPEISIFHNPSSPPSTQSLALLRSALSGPYPPNTPGSTQPLTFSLSVVEAPPTADQLRTIMAYLSSASGSGSSSLAAASTLFSAHPSAPALTERPTDAETIVELAQANPNVVRWPIVVDWSGGRASVGDVEGVRRILEALRKARDSEGKEE
ncbi:hypothetical protein AMATHDRAFT_68807 [Amanita thiersii Skay4041]|uniref:Thioredoxin-like fold domain-containing protein n=1 Tax=Amanita thiersii Skay4041 TaxID=703135 RepID=A0A2A9NGM0_9AGAR|nr:hypothetical protein AMATHDRAFT_68807 [Amanita thiersii Skay4041]